MALWFYCELARKERHKAMTSKTLSLGLNKRVFSVFVNHKHRVLQVTRKKPSHAAHVLPSCFTGVAPCLLQALSKRSPNALLTDS